MGKVILFYCVDGNLLSPFPEPPRRSFCSTDLCALAASPHLPNPSKLCNPQLVGPCVGKGIEEAVSLNVSMFSSGGGFSGLYDLQT
eukprot:TRINITY_DN847_c0_g1_i4.p2 TRINITY_DN847_c0_g1~~TRINITY_DN847_c0_g1_i4.p2  ORF type:complete len:100 (+),score=18.41 TRINITY_DN847_c0_g1_i4:45-302(+)